MSHTHVDTQKTITQETPSIPSGQLTPSTAQESEETLSNHPDGQPIDSVELGHTFKSPSMCVIISNACTLCYSALGTFIHRHKAIFTLYTGPPQPKSDVGAGTSARIINNQLKAVDFEDDIILQWQPGRWSNLAKDTASA
jgi:hypothetical protein